MERNQDPAPDRRQAGAGGGPLRALTEWTRRSVLNRLTAIGLGTSLALLVIVGVLAFPLFYAQAQANQQARLHNHLQRAEEQLRFRGATLLESLEHLAANSFVVNAFVDSTGRDLYLLPTLRDHRAPFGLDQSLTLFDSNLAVFADARPPRAPAALERETARIALAEGRPRLAVDTAAAVPRLLIAVPVYYPPARAHEGVLLAVLPLRELLQPVVQPTEGEVCIGVEQSGRVLAATPCEAHADTPARHALQGVMVPRAGGDVGFLVSVTDRAASAANLMARLTGLYVALSMVALVVVFAASRAAGRPFADKLEELARTANELAADPDSRVHTQWEHPDEIGRLTESFETLVSKWREIQSSLEERVEQRTRELAAALEQARESSRAKTEFLAVMSHEIRTPMNGVVGMIQVLESTPLSAAQRGHLQVIHGSSRLLLRIIDDLLDFSKVEAGKLTLEHARLRMDRLAQETMLSLVTAAQARGVDLDLVLDAGSPGLAVEVIGDPTRLRQVLTNLVHNAIKFTEPGGHVALSVRAEADGGGQRFRFEVRDDGIGIRAEQLQRIFEPFEQADRSTTRRYGGTGLGLAIVKRLVTLMGGEIAVDSEPGRGSVFRIGLTLPAARPLAATAGVAGLDAEPDFAALEVLVVEDNLTNQLVATAMLQTLGVEHVAVADDGSQAVEMAGARRFDLILMDVQMPVMDGVEATRVLREAGVRTPIVAMTANVMSADHAAYLAAGMDDTLAKPMERERLRQVIRRCLRAAVAAG